MKPKLYRMPKDPGYLGGFYLTPTIVGFLCLLLTNVAATQYIAAHFQYQTPLENLFFVFSGSRSTNPLHGRCGCGTTDSPVRLP